MAKELPYFQFEVSEWQNGEIQVVSDKAKVAFIEICCTYWSRLGDLSYAFALRKHCSDNKEVLNELESCNAIKVENDKISISFLDLQFNKLSEKSEKAKQAAEKRWAKKNNNADAMQPHSESNANRREEKRKEENKKENILSFDEFWEKYDKKVDKVKCKKKFNKLTEKELTKIKETLTYYINSKPDKKYRKNPLTYLNGKCWEDEIEKPKLKQSLKSLKLNNLTQ